MATKCPKCQFDNTADSRFCKECGTQLIPSEGPLVSKTLTMETPAEGLARGTVFAGRYEILEELGGGGMGKVYRVYDRKLEEEVALKLIRPEIAADGKVIERFQNEIKISRKITHKNVCRMHDLGEAEGSSFITMEYVRGEDLRSLLHRTKTLHVGTALSIARQVMEGLSEAHGMGVVHRDLKPGNIMIDKEGNAKIMDFGIARSLLGKGMTGEGAIIGTPEYMSPEQVEGKPADARSDLYALGVILFEMVTGQAPFEGDIPLSIAHKHRYEPPPNPQKLNPHIPDGLCRIILLLMEKEREKRYQTAGEVLADLRNIKDGFPLGTKIKPRREAVLTAKIRKKLFILASVFVALATVISLSIFVIKRPSSKKPIVAMQKQLTFRGNVGHAAISPDGKFIVYNVFGVPGELKIMIQDLVNDQALEILSVERCDYLQSMPDGSRLSLLAGLKKSGYGIFIIPRLGGAPRKIEAPPFLAWSPDGSRFAGVFQGTMAIGNESIGISETISLSLPFTWIRSVKWSPLGNLILLLTEEPEQKWSIWTITPDGNKWSKVIEDNVPITSFHWSPKGDSIFYFRGLMQESIIRLEEIPGWEGS